MVHSRKHYVQFGINQITFGTGENLRIALAVEDTAANLASEVAEGSTVKAVYIELWLQNQGNLGESIVVVEKSPQNASGATFANMADLNAYPNKKNVLFTHQGLTSNDGVSGPVFVLKNWIKIPKSKQRMGLGDSINLSISNVSSSDLNRCGFSTFKEYT